MKLTNLKFFLAILFASQYLITTSQAEDARDLQIEGISIGDNLTKYMSKEEIFKNEQGHYPKKSKFFETQLPFSKGNYDYILFHIKRNDKNFEIHLIRAASVVSNLNECMSKKKIVLAEMKSLIPNVNFRQGKQKHYFYKNTTQNISQFEFKNGDLAKLECIIYDEKDEEIHGKLIDVFDLSIGTSELFKWLEKL